LSSSQLSLGRRFPKLRRALPWIFWFGAALVVASQSREVSTVGVAPGHAELRQVLLSAPRTSRVASIDVATGQRVEAGDVLVQLDTSGIEMEKALADAELDRLRLDIFATDEDSRGGDMETADKLADDAERAAVDLARLQADEKRDRGELAQLEAQIERQAKLIEQKLASSEMRDELELRRSALAQLVAEYEPVITAAREHLTSARARLATWLKERPHVAKGSKGTKDAKDAKDGAIGHRLAPLHAAVRVQEERVRQLASLVEGQKLRAPIAGFVGDILVTAGSTAAESAPIVSVIGEAPTRVIAYVDQRWARAIGVGDVADLRPSDRIGGGRSGRVTMLAASIAELPVRFRVVPTQPSFGRQVFIDLDPSPKDGPPLPGQAFDVTFHPKKP
jgi:multidrug resistance efflux pump